MYTELKLDHQVHHTLLSSIFDTKVAGQPLTVVALAGLLQPVKMDGVWFDPCRHSCGVIPDPKQGVTASTESKYHFFPRVEVVIASVRLSSSIKSMLHSVQFIQPRFGRFYGYQHYGTPPRLPRVASVSF